VWYTLNVVTARIVERADRRSKSRETQTDCLKEEDPMFKQKQWMMVVVIAGLLMGTLACGTGYSTSYQRSGDRGKVVVNIKSVDGSRKDTVQIDENFVWDTVTLDITVEVESGDYSATFIDDEGQSLRLEASPGNPASASTQMETDGSGEITLQSEGEGVEGVKITIEYSK
jgi:hypothetical protein